MSTVAAAPRGATVAVAFSGGRDSLALLHATCHAAKALGLDVLALHVHHGLQPVADDWLRSAQALCARWRRRGLPLRLCCQRVTGQPAVGDSIEAWARRERYAALGAMARDEDAGLVLLAHHRRDQAETVVLQALRGAGPRGLSAMPKSVLRDGITWARPWLDQSREAVDDYVLRHRLRPIEDPSNRDPRLARGRLRTQVWPALKAAFVDAESAMSTLARRAQEAQAVLDEVAASDLSVMADESGLRVDRWLGLSPARRGNALRAWLHRCLGRGAPESLIERLQRELPASASGRWPLPRSSGAQLLLYRNRLALVPVSLAEPCAVVSTDLSHAGRVEPPGWPGCFEIRAVKSRGVSPQKLRQLQLRPRAGAEQFQCTPDAVPRSLKKQYQAKGVSTAARRGPLVWADDRLVYVPGLGIDARLWAADGEPQLAIEWISSHRVPAGEPSMLHRSR